MNRTQLKRWLKVSIGLANSGYPTITPKRRELLIAEITCFIETVTSSFALDQIKDWDGNGGGCYVCDELSTFLWDNRYEFERERNGGCEVARGRFGTALSCCIRAGFDMAVAPSGGVVGYTVGDLRKIFAGKLPKWISNQFTDELALAGDHEGIWL